jgi:hypothetical protein
VAQLTRDIVAQAHENNWFPEDESSEQSHRIVVVGVICEVLAKLGSTSAYTAYAADASQHPGVKRKHLETDDNNKPAAVEQQLSEGTSQPNKKTRGASGATVKSPTDRQLVQDPEDTALQVPKPQRRQRVNRPHRGDSPLFVQQDADACRASEGTISDNVFNSFDAAQESIPDPRAKDQGSAGKVAHKRAESMSSEDSWDMLDFSNTAEIGYRCVGANRRS